MVLNQAAPAEGRVTIKLAEIRPALRCGGIDARNSDPKAAAKLLLDETAVQRYMDGKRSGAEMPSAFCAIYIIAPAHAKVVKVGSARDVVNRLSHLQTGAWEALSVKGLMWTTHKGRSIEGWFHHAAKKRGFSVSGEWYSMSAEQAAELLAYVAGSHPYPICGPAMFLDHWLSYYLEWEASNPASAVKDLPKSDRRLKRYPRIPPIVDYP